MKTVTYGGSEDNNSPLIKSKSNFPFRVRLIHCYWTYVERLIFIVHNIFGVVTSLVSVLPERRLRRPLGHVNLISLYDSSVPQGPLSVISKKKTT